MTSTIRRHDAVPLFSDSYAQARERFAAAKAWPRAWPRIRSRRAAPDEALSTDVALIGDAKAERLLIMTSATHGAEGFCGSGCQLALLDDAPMLARARDSGVALLLVHAVNPYGFSWIARTDEGNVDLNRNAQPFDGRPPRTPATRAASVAAARVLAADRSQPARAGYIAEHGLAAYAQAVSRGQYTHADGLFYGGDRPAASLLNMRRILKEHAADFSSIGWIDVHGAGAARPRREDLRRPARRAEVARARHGTARTSRAYQGSSASVDITGQLASVIYDACPTSTPTLMALEFGTQPLPTWCRRCVAATGCARIRKPARTRAGPF